MDNKKTMFTKEELILKAGELAFATRKFLHSGFIKFSENLNRVEKCLKEYENAMYHNSYMNSVNASDDEENEINIDNY